MRIVQLANCYGATSGGLRTAVDTLGAGYAAAGHERILVVPGRQWQVWELGSGTTITVPGTAVGGGYRMILRTGSVERLLERLNPDVIEVSDKYTLTAVADWAARRGVGTVLFSHERLDAIVPARLPRTGSTPPARAAIRAWNQRVVSRFDTVVVTSAFAEGEFKGLGVRSMRRVTLGVDLDVFRPRDPALMRPEPGSSVRLAYAGRLSPEKNAGLAIATVRTLASAGHPVVLDVYGTGPALPELRRLAIHAPVRFHGHVADRDVLADCLAAADAVLAPCLVETFGLTVLEALACGTPVVAAAGGAAGELLGEDSGVIAPPTGVGMAAGVLDLIARPEAHRRAAAREQAERHPWSRAVAEMLEVHTAVATGRRRSKSLIAV
ncbi:glycosyltransferase [Actinospica robiniae]|uniref:glycosyltransferase n=1 Tax=Actinospica robiniae TaxID=304901 RepID=UPI00041D90E0|nr:glycosyltransferase [Actinospica robiniae]